MNKCKFSIFMSLVLVLAVLGWTQNVFSWRDEPGCTQDKEFPVVTVNHLSYPSLDYKKTRDFYVDLLGFRVVWDDGTKCQVDIGDAYEPNSMYLTTGTAANAGRLAHYGLGLPGFFALSAELGAELVRRGFAGVRPDGQAGWFVNTPSGWVQHFTVVKDPCMFPGAATPCAVCPSAACTAAYQKGLQNLGSIPPPSGTGFTALYFKYIILQEPADVPHVRGTPYVPPWVAQDADFYKSLMGMAVLSDREHDFWFDREDDVWLRFGQNTLVIRPAPAHGQPLPFTAPFINEFGFVVANYDPAKVKAELDRRGIPSKLNAFGGYEFLDPNGLVISINGSIAGQR